MEPQELETRFTYHPPKPGQAETYERIRAEAKRWAVLVDHAAPDCREKALAFTAIEEAVMWANAAIARRS
jgi:hypothetical protein